MKRINEHIRIADLISKEILGLISKNELSELNKWRSDNSNLELYTEILERKGSKERNSIINSTDINHEWSRFSNSQKLLGRKFIYSKVLKYAAVLLPIIMVSSFIMVFYETHFSDEVEVRQAIEPGGVKAELILSDGKKVDISVKNNFVLKEVDGTNLSNLGNELSYEKDSGLINARPVYNTIKIPQGGEFVLTLSDGTKVWINSMSTLKYPVLFGKGTRTVELSGEAFFDVSKDKSRPFIVKMNGYNVKVLGTTFNVSSYDEEELIHTTLATGRVEIHDYLGGDNKKITIKPGEQFVYNKRTRKAEVKEVNVKVFAAWKEGYFMFDENRLEDVFLEMQRWYGIEVFYRNNCIREKVFTGKLPKFENLETILKMMKKVGNVRYNLKGKTLYLE